MQRATANRPARQQDIRGTREVPAAFLPEPGFLAVLPDGFPPGPWRVGTAAGGSAVRRKSVPGLVPAMLPVRYHEAR